MAIRSASRANTSSVVAPSMRSTAAAPGPALLAGAEDLDDRLRRRRSCAPAAISSSSASTSELRNSDERWQLGADEMKVARMAVGRLEPRAAFAEIDLAGDAGVDHPLQRAVDGGAADARVLAADEIEQIVGAEVTFLAQEDLEDAVALGGALAAGRAQASPTSDRRSEGSIPTHRVLVSRR